MKKSLTVDMIETFLYAVDDAFPVPLSKKQNLKYYAVKLFSSATICAEIQNGNIISMVAGYTETLSDDIAYIAVVATLNEAKGRGFASNCVKEFIEVCRQKSIPAVHLYTSSTNEPAKAMYKKIGFVTYFPEKEPRPQDTHFIYKILKES